MKEYKYHPKEYGCMCPQCKSRTQKSKPMVAKYHRRKARLDMKKIVMGGA